MVASSLVVALALVAGGARAAAPPERIALVPATGTNVAEGLLAAAQDVLKGHLERSGRFEVSLAAGAAGVRAEPSAADVAQAVRAAQAERGLALRITRLGATAKVRLSAYDAGGALLGVDELGAASPDDLDAVLARLARGLATGRPASAEAEIDTVTEREADALPKMAATHAFGVRLGELVSLARPRGGSVGIPGIGVFWLYDAREILAEIGLDYHGRDDDHAFAIGLGAYYPFLRTNATPYAGGTLRYAWTNFGGSGSSGLQVGGALGMLHGRLSTVQFRAELGYFVNVYRERSFDAFSAPFASPVERSAIAHGPTFSVGLGF